MFSPTHQTDSSIVMSPTHKLPNSSNSSFYHYRGGQAMESMHSNSLTHQVLSNASVSITDTVHLRSTSPHSISANNDDKSATFKNVMELQQQVGFYKQEMSSLTEQLGLMKDKYEQNVSEVKNYWCSELNKERIARKDDNIRYSQLKDMYTKVTSENQRNILNIQQLRDIINRLRQKNQTGLVEDQEFSPIRCDRVQDSQEIYLLRKTLEEMELRIETQKQTLIARDQSVQKLLEMVHNNGSEFDQQNSLTNINEEIRVKLKAQESLINELKLSMTEKDCEISQLQKKLLKSTEKTHDLEGQLNAVLSCSDDVSKAKSLQAYLHKRDNEVNNLREIIDRLQKEANLNMLNKGITNNLLSENEIGKQMDIFKEHTNFLKAKINELKQELSRKECEATTCQTKLDMLLKQNSDQQRHIAILQEAFSAKEQYVASLQADVAALRYCVDSKENLLEQNSKLIERQNTYKSCTESEMSNMIEIKEKQVIQLENKIVQLEQLLTEKENLLIKYQSKESVEQGRNGEIFPENLKVCGNQDQKGIMELDKHTCSESDLARKFEMLQQELVTKNIELARFSSLSTCNNKKDLDLKTVEIDLLKKGEDLLQSEKIIQGLSEEIELMTKEKEEMSKQVRALEEQVNHYIDELATTQAELDKLADLNKELESEKRIQEKRLLELELELATIMKTEANGRKNGANDVSINGQQSRDTKIQSEEMMQDFQRQKSLILEKEKCIHELEDALRESEHISAEREDLLEHQHQQSMCHMQKKVEDLSLELEWLSKELGVSNKKLSDLSFYLGEKEAKLQQLQEERRRQIEEVLDIKHEALLSSISEKDAHIALIENMGTQTTAATNDLKKLRGEKEKLVQQLREQSEKKAKVLQNLEAKMGRMGRGKRGTPGSSAGGAKSVHTAGSGEQRGGSGEQRGQEDRTSEEGVWA